LIGWLLFLIIGYVLSLSGGSRNDTSPDWSNFSDPSATKIFNQLSALNFPKAPNYIPLEQLMSKNTYLSKLPVHEKFFTLQLASISKSLLAALIEKNSVLILFYTYRLISLLSRIGGRQSFCSQEQLNGIINNSDSLSTLLAYINSLPPLKD
jgi:hypothetical protein